MGQSELRLWPGEGVGVGGTNQSASRPMVVVFPHDAEYVTLVSEGMVRSRISTLTIE